MNNNGLNNQLDKEEKQILDGFMQIEVDTDRLKGSINMKSTAKRRSIKFSVAVCAALLLVVLSGTVYATSGGLEQFLSRFNPAFGQFAIPPLEPAYAVDGGIRFEVYGAQVFDNIALLYFSLQDTSGENRLSENTIFDYNFMINNQLVRTGSSSRRLHFNKDTNTLYFEVTILSAYSLPNPLIVGAESILYFPRGGGQVQTLLEGQWWVEVTISDTSDYVIYFEDFAADDLHINFMKLSPLGVYLVGTHNHDVSVSARAVHPRVEIETSAQRRNIRIGQGSSGGIGQNCFEIYLYAESPIDVSTVTAVIVNGVRVPVQ